MGTKLSCYDDLTEHEKFSCDRILSRIMQLNRTGQSVDDETRKEFWGIVFCNWNTGQSMVAPIQPSRHAAETSVLVGHFARDTRRNTRPPNYRVPGSRHRIFTEIPDNRRQGADVFLQVSINLDTQTYRYRWVDSENRTVPREAVKLNNMTMDKARSLTIAQWDRMEMRVQGNYNVRMAVWYARTQLISHLKQRDDCESAANKGEECPGCKYQDDAAMPQLKDIRLCGDSFPADSPIGVAYREHQGPIRGTIRYNPAFN
ncbi:hypothetical protein CSOJ01_02664 [Colletotrichum sojae]|uniref:Uncharacterized protein n=1 Tax=Colletotrichum sojae TaxID=2175907 RepID=A0A8H6JQ41_9PEZI|nr:hypothetical protein CSOJ01_02664 [Colletotrichum sojae]